MNRLLSRLRVPLAVRRRDPGTRTRAPARPAGASPTSGTSSVHVWPREYHSQKGVFGYRPPQAKEFVLSDETIAKRSEQSNLFRFVSAYREYGHLQANLNPLKESASEVPELDPRLYGLKAGSTYDARGLLAGLEGSYTLEDLEGILREKYCGKIAAEFTYLPTLEEREWFAAAFESLPNESLSNEEKVRLAVGMLHSQAFDQFLATKFQSVKRYGAEGAETMTGFFTETFRQLAEDNVEQCIIAMAHRGRLNLLTGVLQLPPVVMFQKMKGLSEFPPEIKNTGDVLSHLTNSLDLEVGENKFLHVTMLPNPSHLEAVNPVACGKTRARQRSLGEGHFSTEPSARPGDKVVCLQVHGDAALSGQGVMQETLALSNVPHFDLGGALHVSINNQVGYTTPGERTRSTRYCTDIAKMCSMPVIHVNGDDPEAVVKAARLAVQYQRKFRRDVFVDLVCWRRWGHNELDNPRFTNPSMYRTIDARKSVPDSYIDTLVAEGLMTREDVMKIVSERMSFLAEQHKKVDTYVPKAAHLERQWSGLAQAPSSVEVWDTGVDIASLKYLGAKSVSLPEDFNIHPHLKKTHVETRLKKLMEGTGLDWATAEALAFATLLNQGTHVIERRIRESEKVFFCNIKVTFE